MLTHIHGSFIISQTPFGARGEIDLDSIDSLVSFYFGHGAKGLVVLGVSGEASKLDAAESIAVMTRFIKQAEDRPVIVGVSNPSLGQLVHLTEEAMSRGAAGVMISPPAGLHTEEDLFSYFSGVFDRIKQVPVVLQDFPGASGVWMSVPSIRKLVDTFPQIQVIKEEEAPSLGKISRLRENLGKRVAILTGNNGMYLPYEMARGIDGPMAGFSHPEMLSGVYKLFQEGRTEQAHDLFDCYLPLLAYEAQGFPGVAARKEGLRRRGAIAHATMRMPGATLTAQHLADIDLLHRRVEKAVAQRHKT